MNSLAEAAFKAWLLVELDGAGFGSVAVHTGLTGDHVDQNNQAVHCFASDSERVVGPLTMVTMEVMLQTPPHSDSNNDEAVALTAHRDVLSALRESLESYDTSDLAATYLSVAGIKFCGGFVEGESEGISDGNWVTNIKFTYGTNRS